MTICKDCKHFLKLGNIWYDMFCKASPREDATDPVTGEAGYAATNSVGGRYITDKPFNYASDINKDGNCSLFKKKIWLQIVNPNVES